MKRHCWRPWVGVGALLALAGTQGWGQVPPSTSVKPWTVMVYMSGDDTDAGGNPASGSPLEDFSIDDVNEMEQVGSGPGMNVVMQWDRGTLNDVLDQAYPTDPTQSWQTTRRYYIVKDPNQENLTPQPFITDPLGVRIFSPMLEDLGELAMGEQDTLVEFVTWAITRFPAERYLLVLWNHGGGWQPRSRQGSRGIIFDEIGPAGPSFLANTDLSGALSRIRLRNGGRNLDILAMDASGMGLLEVHYQMREGVNYVMSTFLFGPGDGFPYNVFLEDIAKNPRQSNEALLRKLVSDYVASYQTGQPTAAAGSNSVTLAATDQRRLSEVVEPLDALAQYLITNLRDLVDEITQARGAVQTGSDLNVPTRGDPNSVDLYDLARQLRSRIPDPAFQQIAQQLMNAIGGSAAVVVAEGHLTSADPTTVGQETNVDDVHGLGIYFPASTSDYDPLYQRVLDLSTDAQWDDFLRAYLNLFSDLQGPSIEITYPRNGDTIQSNRPTITALIRDQGGGRVDPGSIELTFDGQLVDPTAYDFDLTSGQLTFTPASSLSQTAHIIQLAASDIAGNPGQPAFASFRVARQVLPRGLQMISIPLQLSSGDPAQVIGTRDFVLSRWNPADSGSSKYRTYPDPFASLLPSDTQGASPTVSAPPAGLGYWIRLTADTPLLISSGQMVQAPGGYRIRLRTAPGGLPEWNMIGNPFNEIIGWSSVQFERGGERLTVFQAVDRDWTNGILYEYVPNYTNPNLPGHYDFRGVGGGALQPWKGYWVLAKQDVTLLVPTTRSREAPVPAAAPLVAPGGWQIQLQARQGGTLDPVNFVGVSDLARDGYDHQDILEPPPLPGAVSLSIPHEEWGEHAGRYARDLRARSGGEQVWTLQVESPQEGEVELTWEGLRTLPAECSLELEDLASHRSVSLRTQSGYRYAARAGERRILRLRALPAGRLRLAFQQVEVTPTRGQGVEVRYRLNQPARLRAEIHTVQGRTVWSESAGVSASRGALRWNRRDLHHRPLPPGIYLLQLTAETEEGHQVRSVRTLPMF